MKKSVLGLLGVTAILGTSLVSCGNNNEVKLTDAQSRNLRLASGINLISPKTNAYQINKAQSDDDKFSANISLALPSLDIVVENNFNIDAQVEGEEGSESFTYNGMQYSFKETISYIDSNDKNNSLILYYNYQNSLNENYKYDENIKGVVTFNEETYVNFTSTARIEDGHSKRELSLYVGKDESTSLVINEETVVNSKELNHQFTYKFKLSGRDVISYSISLDRSNTTMSVKFLTFSFDLTRKDENKKVTYKAIASETWTETSLELNFVKEIVDDKVTYKLDLSANKN